MEKLEHVLGDTWCAHLTVDVPLYRLGNGGAVLLDSGYADRDRADLLALLEAEGLRVRAVVGSHSHNDHNGSHAYFQRLHGAEIILQEWEAELVTSFPRLRAAYRPATAGQLERLMPHMLLRADRTFSDTDRSVEVCGRTFGLLPLPGHTAGHTGIVTPDGVCYVGDALVCEQVLRTAKLPSVLNWEQDLASKRRLRETDYPAYILAHRGVYSTVRTLAEQNLRSWERRAEQARSLITAPLTLDQICQLLWRELDVHSSGEVTRLIFRRNAACLVEYLVDTGRLECVFDEGTARYAPK